MDGAGVNPSTALATVLIDELIAGGVTDAVLAPGSRNAPLSMALAAADAAGRIRLHVRIDERTAGFLALGLARGSGRPAVVVTTSGTAVANLHPAVLEAHHGGVPMMVLTADRPPELRDVGANQVIDQRAVFTGAVRFFHEFGAPVARAGQNAAWRSMVSRALAHTLGAGGGWAGPVHLNVPLVDPLLPDPDRDGDTENDWPEDLQGRNGPWTRIDTADPDALLAGWDTGGNAGRAADDADTGVPMIAAPEDGERVLYLGDLTHPAAGPLAALGHVVVSEAGGAAGAAVISTGMHLLGVPGFLEPSLPDRVVVLGRPTLYRQTAALLADSMITVDVLAPSAAYADQSGRARRVAPVLAPLKGPGDPEFVDVWRQAEDRAAAAVSAVLERLEIGAGPRLAAELIARLPATATLFLGSSQSPRDVGLASAPRDGLRLIANRGVAGIDGSVSTALGVALSAPAGGAHSAPDGDTGPTYALLGDLTFLHDSTGLLIGPGEPTADLTIVVSNNDGGGIFSTLESGDPAHARHFSRIFGTPTGVDLAGWAAAAGWRHLRVDTVDGLGAALEPSGGRTVVEVRTTREHLRDQHATLRAAVSAAVRG